MKAEKKVGVLVALMAMQRVFSKVDEMEFLKVVQWVEMMVALSVFPLVFVLVAERVDMKGFDMVVLMGYQLVA